MRLHSHARDARGRRRRRHGGRGRRAAALTTTDIRPLIDVCDDSLAGLRHHALLLIGFAGALRRSELAAIDLKHLTWTDVGVTLLIPRSKTDGGGEGAEIQIAIGKHPTTCPVTALRTWLERAKIASGPAFRKVARGGHVQSTQLTGDAIREILRKRAAQAGLQGTLVEPVSPHGLRAGFVTTAYRNGVTDEEIMGHTRHRSLATMRSYVRRAKLSKTSPSSNVDL